MIVDVSIEGQVVLFKGQLFCMDTLDVVYTHLY